ncbi:MAG TPA: AraC family transcriptional regulator [Armatimonadota bacterium]|jgi:AraC-like DNA-binding protein
MTIPNYIRNAEPTITPQLLRILAAERPYSLSILHAGMEYNGLSERAARSAPHTHDLYHIVLFTEGENRFFFRNSAQPCHPGTLVVTGPGEQHTFLPLDPGKVRYVEVTFEYVHGQQRLTIPFHALLCAYTGQSLPAGSYPIDLSGPQWHYLEALLRTLPDTLQQAHPAREFYANVVMMQIFTFLVQQQYEEILAGSSAEESRLLRAREEIERRFRERLTVGELAEGAGWSVGYFSRAFTRRFGIAPIRYQQLLRITAAKNLLTTTDLSCHEIAARLGFTDAYYFSRTFHQLVGVPPRQYRTGRRSGYSGSAFAGENTIVEGVIPGCSTTT